MGLYARGNKWWLRFKCRGEVVRLPTGCDLKAKKEAQAAARRLRVEYEAQAPAPTAELTLGDLEELHLEWLEDKGRSELRLETVRNLWRNLFRHLGGEHRDAMTVTLAELQAYEGKRRRDERPAKGQTIRREVQALVHKGYRLAKRHGLIDRLPFDPEDLETIESDAAKHEQEAKARSDKEINRVLLALSRKAKRAGHHKMLRFIRLTGLRLEEFRRYDPSWLHPTYLRVPTIATKTGRVTQVGRDLPLTKEAYAIAKEWGHAFAGKKFNHALVLASRRAGVSPTLTPRDLRATYITEIARKDPAAAQYLAGHTSLATTAKYVQIDRDDAVNLGARTLKKGAQRGGHSKQAKQKKAKKINGRP